MGLCKSCGSRAGRPTLLGLCSDCFEARIRERALVFERPENATEHHDSSPATPVANAIDVRVEPSKDKRPFSDWSGILLAGVAIFTVLAIPLACVALGVQAAIRCAATDAQDEGATLSLVLQIAFDVLVPWFVVRAIWTLCRTAPTGEQ